MPLLMFVVTLLLAAALLLTAGDCRLDEARRLLAASRAASVQGDYRAARERVEESLKLTEPCGEQGDAFRDIAFIELSDLCRLTGESRKSLMLMQSMLAQRESELGPSLLGVILDNTAKSLADLHRYYEAEPLCRRAIQLQETSREPYLAASAWNTLGTLFYGLQDPEGAVRQFRRGLSWLEFDQTAPERAGLLFNLGVAQIALGEPAAARASLDEADRLASRVFGPAHPIVTSLNRARSRLPKRLR
jgi:tetratricopeptide (TPR) repeat protein